MGIPSQKGFLRLSGGSLGETTFVKSEDGYRAKEKIVYLKNHFDKNPEYERVRENAANFGNASSAASKIRMCVYTFLAQRKDGKMFRNLQSLVTKVIKLDPTGARGKQQIKSEYLDLLVGFEMNSTCSFKSVFNTRFNINADRVSGKVDINIPAFIPGLRINAPKGSTHFTLIAAASVINFDGNEKPQQVHFESEPMPLNDSLTDDWKIAFTLLPGSVHPIFIYLGVEFTEATLGVRSPVAHRKKDALCIVKVIP